MEVTYSVITIYIYIYTYILTLMKLDFTAWNEKEFIMDLNHRAEQQIFFSETEERTLC